MLSLANYPYSRQEIIDALHGKHGNRQIRFRYDLLDKNDNKIKELDSVVEGEVSMASLSSIKRTARFKIKDKGDINWLTDRIQPFMELKMPEMKIWHDTSLTKRFASKADFDQGVYTNTQVTNTGEIELKSPYLSSQPKIVIAEDVAKEQKGYASGIKEKLISIGFTNVIEKFDANSPSDFSGYDVVIFSSYVWALSKTSLINACYNAGLNVLTEGNDNGTQVPLISSVTTGTYTVGFYPSVSHYVNEGVGNFSLSDNQAKINSVSSSVQILAYGDSAKTMPTVLIRDDGSSRKAHTQYSYNASDRLLKNLITWVVNSHYLTGIFESPQIDISTVGTIYTSKIEWTANLPAGTSLTMETSIDNGKTWQPVTNGEEINGLSGDVTGRKLKYRVTLSTTDTTKTPQLHDVTISLTGKRFYREEEKWIEFPLGIFLLSSPTRKDENNSVYRDVEAYDGLLILRDDKFDTRYTVRAGTNYRQAVIDILASAGITKHNIEQTDKVLPVDMEFAPGTEKLEAINALLQAINYTPLYVDVYGYFTSMTYRSPSIRAAEYTYKDDELSIIYAGMEEELDLFNVPNKWVVVCSNAEQSLMSSYTNSNPNSPTSTVNRGRTIVDYREVTDIADQQSLDAYVQRIAFEASQVYGKLTFETALNPLHDYMDVLEIDYSPLGIKGKYVETGWTMPLKAGARMKHEVRKVVSI
jgi:hypothetical protein